MINLWINRSQKSYEFSARDKTILINISSFKNLSNISLNENFILISLLQQDANQAIKIDYFLGPVKNVLCLYGSDIFQYLLKFFLLKILIIEIFNHVQSISQ